MKKHDIIVMTFGIAILIVGIIGIHFYKVKFYNILYSIEVQEVYVLNKVFKFGQEGLNKQREEESLKEEMLKDIDGLLEEIIQVSEQQINEQNTVKIIFFGDLIYDRYVSEKLNTKEKFDEFFADLKDFNFEEYDFVGLNLETPVVSDKSECEYSTKEIQFCSKNVFLPWVRELGFNIFSIANNHAMDGGKTAHKSTINNLEENEFNYFGYIRHGKIFENNYVFTGSIGDVNFAWHAYDFTIYGDNYLNNYCEDLKNYKKDGFENFVVVHWGNEYQYMTHSKKQEAEAKKLIDCGANLIIGMHTHVIQDIGEYNGVPIIYSLGNFLFDQNWSENTQKGIGVFIEYTRGGEIKIETKERQVSV